MPENNGSENSKKIKISSDGKIDRNKKVKKKRFVLKKFKLAVSIGGYNAGAVILIRCNKKSLIPVDRYWRRRLRDSQIDNCMKEVK